MFVLQFLLVHAHVLLLPVLLLLCLSSIHVAVAAGAFPRPTALGDSLGVNIHFTHAPPQTGSDIASGGFRFIRMDFMWQYTEKLPGVYDFSEWDGLMLWMEAAGLRGLWVLDYGNPLYDGGLAPHSDAGIAAFARWTAAAVQHFAGHGIVWEIWNEPDGSFWKPHANATAYVALAVAAAHAMRTADPGAVIIAPALAGMENLPFLLAVLDSPLVAEELIDAISVHPYRNLVPETVIDEVAAYRLLLRERSSKLEIVVSEWGYSAEWSDIRWNYDIHARLVARELLVCVSLRIPLQIYYDWQQDCTDPSNAECVFGLRNATTGEPLPGYLAVQTLGSLLGRAQFVERVDLGVLGEGSFVLRFELPSGNPGYAVWSALLSSTVFVFPTSGCFAVTDYLGGSRGTLCADAAGRLRVSASYDPVYLISVAEVA